MKYSCIILAIVLYLISIDGQNLNQKDTNSVLNMNDDIKPIKKKLERRMQNYRPYCQNCLDNTNSFQNIGIGGLLKDILVSVKDIATQMKLGASTRYPSYHDYRSEYNQCEASRKELLTLYKELASHFKYSPPPPPPPPQIIYVQYPVPATCNHTVDRKPSIVKTREKTPPYDKNQIWKNTPASVTDEDSDGSRPVSFNPIQSNRPHVKPPPFDHGSTQAGSRGTSNNKPFYGFDRFGNIAQRPRRYK